MFDAQPTLDQFEGCLLGLATGDALGAPHEGGLLEKLIWRCIGRTSDGSLRWTDDTQMALDLAESLLECGGVNADALARRFARSYNWSRGYGPGTGRVLKRIRRGEEWSSASRKVYKNGSYGNGAAMRAAVLALFFPHDRAALVEAARRSAEITHAHPFGVEGAVLIAVAAQSLLANKSADDVLTFVSAQCHEAEFVKRLQTVRRWLANESLPSAQAVVQSLGNGMTAAESCATALYIALRHIHLPFNQMMAFAIECRGDVDTIAAMAGALWGITNGAGRLPDVKLEQGQRIIEIARRLYQHTSEA